MPRHFRLTVPEFMLLKSTVQAQGMTPTLKLEATLKANEIRREYRNSKKKKFVSFLYNTLLPNQRLIEASSLASSHLTIMHPRLDP
jgi:hypothetical protein